MPNADLTRASSRIQTAIKSFCKTRYQTNPLWFANDLHRYVCSYPGIKVAPSSVDRVLRNMRSKGLLHYEVINRSKSFYRIIAIG